MNQFLQVLQHHPPQDKAILEIHSQRSVTYQALGEATSAIGNFLVDLTDRTLVFLYATNSIDSILLYLSCLELNYPVCLLEPNPNNLQRLVAVYHPGLLLLPDQVPPPEDYCSTGQIPGTSYQSYRSLHLPAAHIPLHPELALLLQTSGSTGSPKLVRLTKRSLMANATAIATYLQLAPAECSIQSLPMQYSYGLSLINSHLMAGGTIALTPHSFMRPEFWQDFNHHKCTSFAGVPYMYETLARLRFDPADQATLSTLTQAGGSLRADLTQQFYDQSLQANCRFFVMYGQTEATARIAYVPPERLAEKMGAIGIPIPDGQLELVPFESENHLQELVYRGDNVMMGYAESPESLAHGDELNGVLHTGDLARMDEDGFFYLVGRVKRITKLFGQRINLQDVETELEMAFPLRIAAIDAGSHLTLYAEATEKSAFNPATLRAYAARYLQVPPKVISVEPVEALPITTSGKKDYKALQRQG
jgi:long-chain acyl-CoA synthetase